MKNKLLEKLVYLKSRNVEIKWEKDIPYGTLYVGVIPGTISLKTYPPIMPTQLILYTNDSLEKVSANIDVCVKELEEYDAYLESLEDCKEVLEIKKAFEELTS